MVCLWVADVAPGPPQVKIVVNIIASRSAVSGSLLEIAGGVGSRDLIVITTVSVLAAGTDLGTPDPEAVGNGAASETDESQKRRGPLVVEAVVHLLGEQDDTGTPERSDTGLGGESGSSLVLVGVDQVVVGGVVEEDEAEADGETTESGADPDEIGVRGPGEDEQANGDEPARDHHGNQTDLGRGLAVVLVTHLEVVLVDNGSAGSREKNTDSQGDEHETGATGVPALALLENNGEGNEEHVKQTVENAHVQRNEENDELLEEQLEGSNHEDSETLAHGPLINVLLGNVGVVASRLAELLGAASKNGGCVSLGDGEGDEDPDNTGKDELDPVQPAPASTIRKETTDKRANYSQFG